MPFATSELVEAREQPDGRLQCREYHVDGIGESWDYAYIAPSLASAEADLAARFVASRSSRRGREIQRCVRHFAGGGIWSGFTVSHFATKDLLKKRMLKLFRHVGYPEALDYALPVSFINQAQVVSLLGVSSPVANGIKGRANQVIAHAAADGDWDDDTVDDDGAE